MRSLANSPIVVAIALAAASVASSAAAESALGVDFSWQGVAACSGRPPAFKISGIPAATRTLRFAMKDLDVPSYPHGGGTVAYGGSGDVPAGAFSYTGPCPPSGAHRYEWTVDALDAGGRTLARGRATKPFPPR